MTDAAAVDRALIERLQGYSTPTIMNGLKRLGIAPDAFEVFDRSVVGCMSPELGARCGFAVTRRVATRRTGPVPVASGIAPDQGLSAIPGPRFLVVENVGEWQGPVCIWGDVTSHINRALDCTAGVTNGPVRDLPEMAALGFQSFAGGAAVGGGHVELLDINIDVVVAGVRVSPGDLIHGDRHGVVKIPADYAARLPAAITAHEAWEAGILAACTAKPFDLNALATAMTPKRQSST